MSNIVEVIKGDRKVLLSKDFLPLYGAVLGTLVGKSHGISRFGVLKDSRVAAVLQSCKITKETDQVNEINKAFGGLQSRGLIALSGDKVQSASLISGCAELAQEVVQVAEKIELPKVEGGKRGRPAGSAKSAPSKGNSVQRNPATPKDKKVQRFSLVNGKVTAWTIGKPSKDQRLNECDQKGNIIADIAAINAAYAAAEEAKAMKVQRNPTAKVGGKRFYLKNGVVTPFGLGKPGFDKLSNECTQAGELIDNSALVATLRQPKVATAAKSSKFNELEAQNAALAAQVAQLAEMMKAFLTGGGLPQIPQQVQAVTVAPAAAEVAKVEVAQVTETVTEKPAKPAKAAKSATSKAKPAKAAKVAKSKDIEDEEDPYGSFANNVSDLDDEEPIAFGSDGFVVTEIDY